eukprot:gene4575-6448_t
MIKWRIFNVEVPLANDVGKDNIGIHDGLVDSIVKTIKSYSDKMNIKIKLDKSILINQTQISIVRKSFDARVKKSKQVLQFVYTVDVEMPLTLSKSLKLISNEGKLEKIDMIDNIYSKNYDLNDNIYSSKIIIIGAGPAGLFNALTLANAGFKPIIIERGQPVEIRGRDIGALFNRKILKSNSNLCYGEGGAGTWSDGKLTTRIGKNSYDVRSVLELLVKNGAPERILIDGKPHLGTDRLVKILKSIREELVAKGAIFMFDTKVDDFIITKSRNNDHNHDNNDNNKEDIKEVSGVLLSNGSIIEAEHVILAVGHSARHLYEKLYNHGVQLEPKPIAVGFRIEHPQDLINNIQYGDAGKLCGRGDGIIPVADYKLATEIIISDPLSTSSSKKRSCYSFCMCPGGQIVPTSVNEEELCLNGMSFSKRQSKWANSALVVNVNPEDMEELCGSSPLRGIEWQKIMERRAAVMGGGNFVAPVQRVTDFISNTFNNNSHNSSYPISGLTSSYRLGVKEAPCHDIYPPFVTETIKAALKDFDRRMPGYITPEAIMHGVETRTSAPIQITRDANSFQSVNMKGLYPVGEGAGYAGGIMSAAVDGIKMAKSLIKQLESSINYYDIKL